MGEVQISPSVVLNHTTSPQCRRDQRLGNVAIGYSEHRANLPWDKQVLQSRGKQEPARPKYRE